ncbi:MAG: RNA-guided pseudouridylation complex pseudouridine synthase subunit Cbf5, partial [Fervidicoccaceae archaeon]
MTGVLPIALGKATKVMPDVVHSMKEYVCVMELHSEVSEEEIRKVADEFRGEIYQRPPVRSNVRRRVRKRRIHELNVLEVKGRHVLMRVLCDAGTYMRKLCHDMGLLLGAGAHMRELRRTRSGPFTENMSVSMQRLSEAVYLWRSEGKEDELNRIIYPAEVLSCGLPIIVVKDTAVSAVAHGAPLGVGGIIAYTEDLKQGGAAAVLTARGELVGTAKIFRTDMEKAAIEEKPIANIKYFIIERSLYPRTW